VRALEKAGFTILRQGKHIVMGNGTRILTIPRHNGAGSPEKHTRNRELRDDPTIGRYAESDPIGLRNP
jgi:hypothetical protein